MPILCPATLSVQGAIPSQCSRAAVHQQGSPSNLLGLHGADQYTSSVLHTPCPREVTVELYQLCPIIHPFIKFAATFESSYIRKEKYRPPTPTTTAAAAVSRSGDLPWILKRAGLESSGQRLNS